MKKVLCFRNSKLGDFFISFPALKLIKKKFPNCLIYYLTEKNINCPYLPKKFENVSIVDEFIYYEYNLKGILNLIFKLRKLKFDYVYCFQESRNYFISIRNFIFFLLCNINKKIGFFYKNKDYSKFNEAIQLVHRIDKNMDLQNIFKLKKFHNFNENPIIKGNYITISHGGISSPKLWALSNWSALIELIIKKYNYKIIILGSPKEKKSGNKLLKKKQNQILSMCGKSNIKDLFNLIKFSKLHLTNDNGTMHVASLYDKKTICLFNNHDPIGKWFPLNKNAHIFRPNEGVEKILPRKVFKKIIKLI